MIHLGDTFSYQQCNVHDAGRNITCKKITQLGQERQSLGQSLGMTDGTIESTGCHLISLCHYYSNFS